MPALGRVLTADWTGRAEVADRSDPLPESTRVTVTLAAVGRGEGMGRPVPSRLLQARPVPVSPPPDRRDARTRGVQAADRIRYRPELRLTSEHSAQCRENSIIAEAFLTVRPSNVLGREEQETAAAASGAAV